MLFRLHTHSLPFPSLSRNKAISGVENKGSRRREVSLAVGQVRRELLVQEMPRAARAGGGVGRVA